MVSSRRFVVIAALAIGAGAFGCELALDFDRTKIDGGSLDASFSDAPPADNFVEPGDAADAGAEDAQEDTAAPEDAGDAAEDAADASAADADSGATDADDSG